MPKLLLVEDDELTADVVTLALQYEGFTVHTATNGNSALKLAQTESYDLILSDIMMPEMDGMQFISALRQTPGPNQQTRALAISAMGRKQGALAAGFDGFIAKPFDLTQLLDSIRSTSQTA
ncbi:MAG TPA: response regulator [Planctomycetota bacterium]|nr:response regulator [Planctomycetota bacterium]